MFKFLKRYFIKYGFLYCKHIWKNREARINLEYFKISQQRIFGIILFNYHFFGQ